MKEIRNTEVTSFPDMQMTVFPDLRPYERLVDPVAISRAVLTFENESVLIRRPFRWTKDGEVVPEAEAHLKLEQVCEAYGWNIVERFGEHMAVVSHSCP